MPWYDNIRIGGLNKNAKKKDIPDGLWLKCPGCGEIVYRKELEKNLFVCSKCGHHLKITSWDYISILCDDGSFQELDTGILPEDPLGFCDSKPYPVRLRNAQEKSGLNEAVVCGIGEIDKFPVSLAVMDFRFIGGSMGSVVGEKVTRSIERAIERRISLVIVSASGGARMQEGILSLMQMAKTACALTKLKEAGLPYISVLTNPTTAGVMASYASLGDIVIAEPKALLGFAGPRVIQQTIGEELPEGFQSSEFFLEHGFVDIIVPRNKLKKTISTLLGYLYSG
ncbi:acetyl-CoA carboxylase carboxyltransferase subunit beta [bacterium]|nr:acetyl-CoA carboxylase carboxyltransferase subunit beta [bacterium]